MPGILIIEDTDEDLNLAIKILTSSGYQVTGTAKDGESGLKQYSDISPELVIIDLILPGMNGIETRHKIRDIDPSACIILCTSAGQGSVIELAMRSGANGYVVKPYDPEILLSAVRRTLGSPG